MSSTLVMLSAAGSSSAVVARGYHLININSYSLSRDFPHGHFITSPSFRVAGHTWHVNFFPNGYSEDTAGFVSIVLVLDDDVVEAVKAQVQFSFVGTAEKSAPWHIRAIPPPVHEFRWMVSQGDGYFIGKEALEKSGLLKNDCFTFRCDIAVIIEHCAEQHRTPSTPSHLQRQLGELLLSQGFSADVRFEVGGVTFAAHRCILAAQSPVFRAELFRQVTSPASAIPIYDMEARVFGALLWFTYTDTLPVMTEQEDAAMAPHLLVAADRFAIERLKLICEDELIKHINASSAAIILALAEQHHCQRLREACLAFLNSPMNQNAVVVTDNFKHLTASCPGFLRGLIANIVAAR